MEARISAWIVKQVIRQIARGHRDCFVCFDRFGETNSKR
jgi:hypothetical protein